MTTRDSVSLMEESVGTKLLKALLTELQMLSPRFQAMEEEKQQEVIDRLRTQIEDAMQDVVHTIVARSFQSAPARIVKCAIKDVFHVALEMQRGTDAVHAIADSIGRQCQVVLCNTDEFTGGMAQSVKPTSRQRDIEDRE